MVESLLNDSKATKRLKKVTLEFIKDSIKMIPYLENMLES